MELGHQQDEASHHYHHHHHKSISEIDQIQTSTPIELKQD